MATVLTPVFTSLGLFGRSLATVARNPTFLIFAVLLFATLVGVGMIMPPIDGGIAALLGQFLLAFIITGFEVALARAVLAALDGERASIFASLATAFARVGAIAGYAVIWLAVAIVSRLVIGDGGHPLLSIAWQVWVLGTFMITPVIAAENRSGIDSVRRSLTLFASSIGQTFLVTVWLRALFIAVLVLVLSLEGRWAAFLFLAALFGFWVLRVVQACVLYRFLTSDADD